MKWKGTLRLQRVVTQDLEFEVADKEAAVAKFKSDNTKNGEIVAACIIQPAANTPEPSPAAAEAAPTPARRKARSAK